MADADRSAQHWAFIESGGLHMHHEEVTDTQAMHQLGLVVGGMVIAAICLACAVTIVFN